MTIAEKLYESDPDTLFRITVIYQLEDLARLYFPDSVIPKDDSREYQSLMMPGTYSGKVERRHGAIVQRHMMLLK